MKQLPINEKNFALACGIITGLWVFVSVAYSLLTGQAAQFMAILAGLYPGVSATWAGAVIAAVYGFLDAAIAAYVFAWLYNWLGKRK